MRLLLTRWTDSPTIRYTLRDLMIQGTELYNTSQQTTYPNLTSLNTAGVKVLHIHGEQDFSIPTASSVRYWDSVREYNYPTLGYNESVEALDAYYRLFLVPGGSHCTSFAYEANGGDQTVNMVRTSTVANVFAAASVYAAAADTVRNLYQGNGSTTWLEDLRQDPEPVLLATFPSILGLSGITEVSHDVFYITGANTTGENISDPPKNATKVWKVHFKNINGSIPAIELIAEPVLPLVTDFNGLTTYNDSIILASATFADTVVAMDINTGYYWTAFEDSEMSSINGIKVGSDGYLYWTASDSLLRAPLYDNFTVGASEAIYSGSYDDFAVSYDGFALAQNGTASQKNKVYCVTGGSQETGSTLGGQLFEITLY
ncbi:hypothetical protein LQW54_002057 [Pestalotiopsis sp. IQ-011]